MKKVYDIFAGEYIDESEKSPYAPPERYAEVATDRDCKNCVYSNMTEHSNGCTRWDCEYINIDEAVKAWKFLHNNEKLKSIFEKYCDDCYSAGCYDCGYKPEAMAEFVDCAWRSDENGNGGDE